MYDRGKKLKILEIRIHSEKKGEFTKYKILANQIDEKRATANLDRVE